MIVAFLATLATSQVAATPVLPTMTERKQAGPVEPIPAPAGRQDASDKGLGLALEVNNDKPALSVSIARQLRPSLKAGGADGLTSFFRQTSFSASATSPIGGKDDLVNPQTLNKLSVGPTVTMGVSQFRTSSRDEANGPKPAIGLQFGGEATFGFNRFDYRENGSLTKLSSDKFQYSVAAFASVYPADARSMVSVGMEYQHGFEAQDEEIVCKSQVVQAKDDCVKSPPGPPTEDEGLLLSFELRRTFGLGWSFADLAISPKATVDSLDGDVGLELPIYLLPLESKSPVLPGIKIGYTTEKDDVVFGVFLKAAFGLKR